MRFTEQNNRLKLPNAVFLFLLFSLCLLSVACQTKEQKVESALKKCQALLDKDDLDAATICYGQLVKANPEIAGELSQTGKIAFFKKCVSYKERKDYKQAIICFEGFRELDAKFVNNYFQLADSYYQYYKEEAKANGRPDFELLSRAEEAINAGLRIKPEDAAAHALKGEILKDKGRLQESLESYKKAVELQPQTGIFWVKLGDAQFSLMQDKEAVESYNQALKIDPNDTLALYFLGLQYERMKRLGDAMKTYEKIIQLEPNNEEVLEKLKNVRERLEQLKQSQVKSKTL